MKFEVEKKSHKKGWIIAISVILILGIVLVVKNSFAKYSSVKTIHLVNGTVNYTKGDFSIVAMYKNDGAEDISIDRMPTSGYVINEERSYCNVNGAKDSNVKLYTDFGGQHVIKNLAKGSKCYLYFDLEKYTAGDTLSKLSLNSKGIYNYNNSFEGISTTSDTGIYETEDDLGKSYYFRGDGSQLNNWVKFAGFYWRIIRINGNGSIRMIYSGIANGLPSSSNKTGETTQIGTIMYNHTYNDNAYVGYMMGIPLKGTEISMNKTSNNSTSYEEAHTNTYDSDIKKFIDSWYIINLSGNRLKLDIEAGFCNDREVSKTASSNYQGDGYGIQETGYASWGRLYTNEKWKTSQTPSLKCTNKERDLFTVSEANTGNKALTNPIGLITIDEVIYAGGFGGEFNNIYYLCTNQDYWTMSPSSYHNTGRIFNLNSSTNRLSSDYLYVANGVRPVINLKANIIIITGSGSETDPFIVI